MTDQKINIGEDPEFNSEAAKGLPSLSEELNTLNEPISTTIVYSSTKVDTRPKGNWLQNEVCYDTCLKRRSFKTT